MTLLVDGPCGTPYVYICFTTVFVSVCMYDCMCLYNCMTVVCVCVCACACVYMCACACACVCVCYRQHTTYCNILLQAAPTVTAVELSAFIMISLLGYDISSI